MPYISTRDAQRPPKTLAFDEVLLAGLAPDGGLYVPTAWPRLDAAMLAGLAGKSYVEIAIAVMTPFLDGTISPADFRRMVEESYRDFDDPAVAPLKDLGQELYLLELFHGPTLAFKDFALQLVGRLFDHVLKQRRSRVTIVGATSGDTGSAAIEAFRGLANVDVFILYPHGRVSPVQRRQMTTPTESNVHALAVHGDFDDCQARVKDMFNDFAFRDAVGLAGVNSINWARVLAQVVYYFTSAVSLGAPHRAVSFAVPTGNFGDIFAGYIARGMGLPIEKLVVATNQNDILHRALTSGAYVTDGVRPSMSPSMDIQVSSNFERALFDAYGRDGAAVAQLMGELALGGFTISQGAITRLRATFASGRCSEAETEFTIERIYHQTGEVLCPHTAVGVKVAEEHLGATPMITLATAHPAKFPDAVEAAIGLRPALPARMADLFERPERLTEVPNDLAALQTLIRERIAA